MTTNEPVKVVESDENVMFEDVKFTYGVASVRYEQLLIKGVADIPMTKGF